MDKKTDIPSARRKVGSSGVEIPEVGIPEADAASAGVNEADKSSASAPPNALQASAPLADSPKSKTRPVTFVLVLASFVSSFAGSSLNVSIPTIGAEFHVPAAMLGWLITSFTICALALALPIGRLGDLSSRRTILMIGIGLFTVANISSAFAPNIQVMIGLRVLQGIGGACMFSTNQAIMADAYPPQIRGRMLGITISAVYFGLACGPVVGGLLTAHIGWRAVFISMAVMGALTFTVAFGRLPQNSSHAESGKLVSRLDIPGLILYIIGTSILAWGLNNLTTSLIAIILAVLGATLIATFIWWESRASSPLLNLALFKNNWSFALSNLAAFFNFTATFAVNYLLSIYLQQVKGFGADFAGLVMITAPLTQATITIFAGRISDKVSPFRLASIGCACCSLTLVSFIFVSPESSLIHIFGNLIMMGIGFGLFASPNTNAVMSLVPRSSLGLASAFLGTMRSFGQVISMAIIVVLMRMFLQDQPINLVAPSDLAFVMRICFIIFSCICMLGVFTSLQHKGKRPVASNSDE
ncbi:MAG: MFS transporter [Coriobacteriales bacterium]|jgi:EmrB/QacA subfamily drug resistance transporter|nr:MFS transporter [Coriobacteriales bacterium]